MTSTEPPSSPSGGWKQCPSLGLVAHFRLMIDQRLVRQKSDPRHLRSRRPHSHPNPALVESKI